MATWVWGMGNTYVLLVGVKICEATMKISVHAPQKGTSVSCITPGLL